MLFRSSVSSPWCVKLGVALRSTLQGSGSRRSIYRSFLWTFQENSLVDFTPFELWLVCFRSVGLLCTVIVVLFMQNVDLKQLPGT